MKEKLLVSFSGGRTSAYMCWWLKENKSDVYDLKFIYANTGCEHENSLMFVNQCDKFFKLNLVWVEAKVDHTPNKGTTYTIVDFKTASRKGEPFEEVIKKYGLPSQNTPICNRELKIAPIQSFMKDQNIFFRAIGIREDEFERATKNIKKKFPKMTVNEILDYRYKNEGFYYPLISDRHTSKDEVKYWWSKMPFDLDVEEHYGNCVWCWKKSDRKLWTIAKNTPEYFDFPKKMDTKYESFIPPKQHRDYRNVMYRDYRSADDIIKESNEKEFKEFVDGKTYQTTLFNCEIDEDFTCNECGTIF